MPKDPKSFVKKVAEDDGEILSAEKYNKIKDLIKERMLGKYQNDLNGFIDQMKLVKQSKAQDSTAATSFLPPGVNPFTLHGQ